MLLALEAAKNPLCGMLEAPPCKAINMVKTVMQHSHKHKWQSYDMFGWQASELMPCNTLALLLGDSPAGAQQAP